MPVFSVNYFHKNQTILPEIGTIGNRTMMHPTNNIDTQLSTFFKWLGRMFTLAATAIAYIWAHIYPLVALVEQRKVMPKSGLTFIITVLLAFAGMKSQCQAGFPFSTHPQQVRLSIDSIVMFGFSLAAELIASV